MDHVNIKEESVDCTLADGEIAKNEKENKQYTTDNAHHYEDKHHISRTVGQTS